MKAVAAASQVNYIARNRMVKFDMVIWKPSKLFAEIGRGRHDDLH
jgi:hypothetical protein